VGLWKASGSVIGADDEARIVDQLGSTVDDLATSPTPKVQEKCALYRHFAADGSLLYVGISLSALQRLGQHAESSGWFNAISTVTIEHFETRDLALLAERRAIACEKPRHNIHHQIRTIDHEILADQQQKSRNDLLHQVVKYHPIYSLEGAARVLLVEPSIVRKLVAEGKISFVELPLPQGPPPRGKARRRKFAITGWQLLDYIEGLQVEAAEKPAPASDGFLRRNAEAAE
jgi:hypothetical protein